jgi:hypothetical protein
VEELSAQRRSCVGRFSATRGAGGWARLDYVVVDLQLPSGRAGDHTDGRAGPSLRGQGGGQSDRTLPICTKTSTPSGWRKMARWSLCMKETSRKGAWTIGSKFGPANIFARHRGVGFLVLFGLIETGDKQ